jgi:methionyl-tRNA formyltransferase
MRVFLIGQKWLGAEVLELLRRRNYDVAGCCAPEGDRLAKACGDLAIPPARLAPDTLPAGLDLIVCAHAHVFVKAELRERARLGAVGYHPSLLPRHRGRDAVVWTIKMGDPIAGGSIYWLDDGADTGPIAAQEHCFVHPGDTADMLWRRALGPLGLTLFGRVFDDLERGQVIRAPQDEPAATWEPSYRAPAFKTMAARQ